MTILTWNQFTMDYYYTESQSEPESEEDSPRSMRPSSPDEDKLGKPGHGLTREDFKILDEVYEKWSNAQDVWSGITGPVKLARNPDYAAIIRKHWAEVHPKEKILEYLDFVITHQKVINKYRQYGGQDDEWIDFHRRF